MIKITDFRTEVALKFRHDMLVSEIKTLFKSGNTTVLDAEVGLLKRGKELELHLEFAHVPEAVNNQRNFATIGDFIKNSFCEGVEMAGIKLPIDDASKEFLASLKINILGHRLNHDPKTGRISTIVDVSLVEFLNMDNSFNPLAELFDKSIGDVVIIDYNNYSRTPDVQNRNGFTAYIGLRILTDNYFEKAVLISNKRDRDDVNEKNKTNKKNSKHTSESEAEKNLEASKIEGTLVKSSGITSDDINKNNAQAKFSQNPNGSKVSGAI